MWLRSLPPFDLYQTAGTEKENDHERELVG